MGVRKARNLSIPKVLRPIWDASHKLGSNNMKHAFVAFLFVFMGCQGQQHTDVESISANSNSPKTLSSLQGSELAAIKRTSNGFINHALCVQFLKQEAVQNSKDKLPCRVYEVKFKATVSSVSNADLPPEPDFNAPDALKTGECSLTENVDNSVTLKLHTQSPGSSAWKLPATLQELLTRQPDREYSNKKSLHKFSHGGCKTKLDIFAKMPLLEQNKKATPHVVCNSDKIRYTKHLQGNIPVYGFPFDNVRIGWLRTCENAKVLCNKSDGNFVRDEVSKTIAVELSDGRTGSIMANVLTDKIPSSCPTAPTESW